MVAQEFGTRGRRSSGRFDPEEPANRGTGVDERAAGYGIAPAIVGANGCFNDCPCDEFDWKLSAGAAPDCNYQQDPADAVQAADPEAIR